MKHLKELHEKLEEYNRDKNEHWMILIDGTRLNYVFIVHSEDINTFPSWWPIADTAETIEKALELVPKEETYSYSFFDLDRNLINLGNGVSKNKYHECLRILGVE